MDNHADGIYIYQWSLKNAPHRSEDILALIRNSGGNRSGIAIGNVDWEGYVHLDQFTREVTLGNIKDRSFSQIWTDDSNEYLNGMRNRKAKITGRCSTCIWLDACNGNLRARASSDGDFWASDPACYLTDKEIGG